MFKIIAVTNRKLCHIDFLEQIEALAKSEVDSIILREKDLSEDEYYVLAKNVLRICEKYNKECVLHNFVGVAKRLNYSNPWSNLYYSRSYISNRLQKGLRTKGTSLFREYL